MKNDAQNAAFFCHSAIIASSQYTDVDMQSSVSCRSFRTEGPWAIERSNPPSNGNRITLDNKEFIYFDGYWIRYYAPPPDSLTNRKKLIDHLTRRAFHHTEPGINTPGERLELARAAYDRQDNTAMKRVNAAMLAGALFNRATDVFTAIVELEEKGVKISRENELMRECGQCFKDALELGKEVKHHSGEEGIDELWGEPFRAFTICMEDYYASRYIKIAQTMSNIDQLAEILRQTFATRPEFSGLEELIDQFATAAKCESETMKSDETIFDIWPQFVATGEALAGYQASVPVDAPRKTLYALEHGQKTLRRGRDLINWVARARVPMPKSTRDYDQQCRELKLRLDNS